MALAPNAYASLHALIIDDMATQQTTLRGQLTLLGIGKVDVASSAEDALRLIRTKTYGLVLCDYNLNQKTDGQQFFEHCRDRNLLPSDALFFMITAEGSYASVASATEHRPDAYLLKPVTASDIEDRLKLLMERRQVLHGVHARMARHDEAGALQEVDRVLERKDRWYMQALQLKGQLMLQLGRHEDAKGVYHQALAQRPQLIWAQLGLARAHKAAGEFDQAKHLAYEIIHSPDGDKAVSAYDVLAEAQEAQGECDAALWTLRDAATVVPSARRHRVVAEAAYRQGDAAMAADCYRKVTRATRGSVVGQSQDHLSLAQALVDTGDPAAALAALDESGPQFRTDPAFESVASAVRVQAQVRLGNDEGATKWLARARESSRKPKADFATIALAKAELMTGHEDRGLKLMERALSADHENGRVQQLIRKALRDTGHDDHVERVIEAAAAGLQRRVSEAKKLFRDSRIDEALAAIEAALREYPENTGVLFQATQMTCLSLRLKKQLNASVVEKVRQYLTRLEKLMPANDRVTQMQRYYRDTLAVLSSSAAMV